MSTQAQPTCCLNLAFVRENQLGDSRLTISAKQFVLPVTVTARDNSAVGQGTTDAFYR